jgi:membrane-associated phospholipid phosphatase
MNWESTVVLDLNKWGQNHANLVDFIANKFVYIAIALGLLTFVYSEIKHSTKPFWTTLNLRVTIAQGLLTVAFPVIIATVISEIFSKLWDRQRPFAANSEIKLLFPHANDGGFPSHHMVFTVALAICVLSFHRNVGVIILGLAVLSGIFRIIAGIHYPSDVVFGILLGALVPWLFAKFLTLIKVSTRR